MLDVCCGSISTFTFHQYTADVAGQVVFFLADEHGTSNTRSPYLSAFQMKTPVPDVKMYSPVQLLRVHLVVR